MSLFYLPNIDSDSFLFSEEESRHITIVMRMGLNDQLALTDGQGLYCKGRIASFERRRVAVVIFEKKKIRRERNYRLHMAVAPVKNYDRFEWFLEKATEIGVDEITPVICRNSERATIRYERSKKILISAMKQSLKFYLPVLNPICSLEDFLLKKHEDHRLFIAYCGEGNRELLKRTYQKGESAVIMIGPEGDFAPEEVSLARAHNYQVVSLGESRLRSETAGIVACHTLEIINQ